MGVDCYCVDWFRGDDGVVRNKVERCGSWGKEIWWYDECPQRVVGGIGDEACTIWRPESCQTQYVLLLKGQKEDTLPLHALEIVGLCFTLTSMARGLMVLPMKGLPNRT